MLPLKSTYRGEAIEEATQLARCVGHNLFLYTSKLGENKYPSFVVSNELPEGYNIWNGYIEISPDNRHIFPTYGPNNEWVIGIVTAAGSVSAP